MIQITTVTLIKFGALGNPKVYIMSPNGERSETVSTRRNGLLLLQAGLDNGLIDADTASRLRTDLETAELPEGAFFEMCGTHAHLMFFEKSMAIVMDKKEARDVVNKLGTNKDHHLSSEIVGLMEAEIVGLELPEELTEEQRDEQERASNSSRSSVLEFMSGLFGSRLDIVEIRFGGPPTEQSAAEAYAGPGPEDLDDINEGTQSPTDDATNG